MAGRGVELGGLCLYFEDTPVLDQLAALAMHVQAGEERDLVADGNLYSVTQYGLSHPILVGRKRDAAVAAVAAAALDNPALVRSPVLDRVEFSKVRDDYCSRRLPDYVSVLAVQLLGRSAKAFMDLTDRPWLLGRSGQGRRNE